MNISVALPLPVSFSCSSGSATLYRYNNLPYKFILADIWPSRACLPAMTALWPLPAYTISLLSSIRYYGTGIGIEFLNVKKVVTWSRELIFESGI